MDAFRMAQARQTLWTAVRSYIHDPNISLIGLGWKDKDGRLLTNDVSIRFHVRQKLSGLQLESAETEPISTQIAGFKTDVVVGRYYVQRGWSTLPVAWHQVQDERAQRQDVVSAGVSIGHEYSHGRGTLGALVVDRDDLSQRMCLSNWHVLAGRDGARRGQRIYQPGPGDGGNDSDTFATLDRHVMGQNLDAAVARLTGSRPLRNDQYELGPVHGVRPAYVGMPLIKSGRGSHITQGRVSDVDAVVDIPYNGQSRYITNVVVIDQMQPRSEVSRGGDSGSIWMQQESNQAVGLHFAGYNDPERALAMDMTAVLNALKVYLVVS